MFTQFIAASLLTLANCTMAQDAPKEEEMVQVPIESVDGRKLDPQTFLSIVRYPNIVNSWVKLKGRIFHKSAKGHQKMPVELRGRFQKDSWRMQLIINEHERWFIRQSFADGEFGTSKILQKEAAEGDLKLADMMIRPEDITLSFLYWDFQKEEEPETVSLQHCRVMLLKHPRSDEHVRIWIASKYFFPIKVQWIKDADAESHRELQFKGFHRFKPKSNKDREFGLVKEVTIRGDGWKTKLEFEDIEGDEVSKDNPPPADLFLKN